MADLFYLLIYGNVSMTCFYVSMTCMTCLMVLNKTDRHVITEILLKVLKVVLNAIAPSFTCTCFYFSFNDDTCIDIRKFR
jgi:hypothetical protein